MGRFDGEVVVVTGAGNGLGRAYSLLLASEGARVVVNDVAGAAAVVAEIEAAGGEALADHSDVRSGTSVAVALDAFGRLDAVVNNAGIGGGGSFTDIAPDDFQQMLDVHLGGTLAVCRAAWPVLRDGAGGRIVNTTSASVFGIVGTSAYVTAKAAIFGLTRALAAEGRRLGIRVNAVMPTAFSQMTARSPHMAPLLERRSRPRRWRPSSPPSRRGTCR